MKEWIKYMKFLLLSSIFFYSCHNSTKDDIGIPINDSIYYSDTIIHEIFKDSVVEKENIEYNDSIMELAEKYDIEINEIDYRIHNMLNELIVKRNAVLTELKDIDNKTNKIEFLSKKLKKKDNEKRKLELLAELDKIKEELKEVREIAEKYGIDIDKELEKKRIGFDINVLKNLPSGEYIMRIDKYRILKFKVKKNGEIILSEPQIDSTTVFKKNDNIQYDENTKKNINNIIKEFLEKKHKN